MNILIVEKSVIERTVSEKLIGVYCIGNFIGKKIFVGYVERPDAYLKRRLLQHVETKNLFHYILVLLNLRIFLMYAPTVIPPEELMSNYVEVIK